MNRQGRRQLRDQPRVEGPLAYEAAIHANPVAAMEIEEAPLPQLVVPVAPHVGSHERLAVKVPPKSAVMTNSRSIVSVVADISNVKELAKITAKDFIKLKAEMDSAERRGMTVYRNEFIPRHMKLAIHRKVELTGTEEPWYTVPGCWQSLDDKTFFDVIPNLFIPQGLNMKSRFIAAAEKLRFKMSDDHSEEYLLEYKLNDLLYECGYKTDLDDFIEEDSAPVELRQQVQLILLRNLEKGSAPEGAVSGIKEQMKAWKGGCSFNEFFHKRDLLEW